MARTDMLIKKHMKALITLIVCLMLMPVAFAQQSPQLLYGTNGKVYKWADHRGNVHYTRHPPEYGSWSEIDHSPPARSSGPIEGGGETDESQVYGEEATARANSGGMSAREIIDRNCVIARNNLALLQNVRGKQLTYINSKGQKSSLDDAAKAARIKSAQDNIKHYCK